MFLAPRSALAAGAHASLSTADTPWQQPTTDMNCIAALLTAGRSAAARSTAAAASAALRRLISSTISPAAAAMAPSIDTTCSKEIKVNKGFSHEANKPQRSRIACPTIGQHQTLQQGLHVLQRLSQVHTWTSDALRGAPPIVSARCCRCGRGQPPLGGPSFACISSMTDSAVASWLPWPPWDAKAGAPGCGAAAAAAKPGASPLNGLSRVAAAAPSRTDGSLLDRRAFAGTAARCCCAPASLASSDVVLDSRTQAEASASADARSTDGSELDRRAVAGCRARGRDASQGSSGGSTLRLRQI